MERRRFFQVSGAGSLIVGWSDAASGAEEGKGQRLAVGHPVVMAPREDGVEVVWRVSGLAKGFVEYGKTEDLGSKAGNDGWGLKPAGKQVLRVRLGSLEANTEYFYRTVTEENVNKGARREESALRRFRTLSGEKTSTRFSVWNDTHKHDETIVRLNELTEPGDFLLWNGDICNDWYQEGEVAQTILTPGGGVDFTKDQPLVVLRGNHDYRGTLAYEVEETVATSEGKPWFAFRSGPVAAICMDTGEDKADDHPALFGRAASEPMREEEARWLAGVIERPGIKDAPYRLLFCHIPLRWTNESKDYGYDWFSRRSRDLWHDSLVKWGCQMVISGHIHNEVLIDANERFPYDQLIGGGPKMGQARVIVGDANAEKLTMRTVDMAGKSSLSRVLKPLA